LLKESFCPSCGSAGLLPFYEVKGVPVHSCLMTTTKREALEFPCGDILLGFCKICGFISNIAYDPKFQNYSSGYEDQQCFSPTFNTFAHDLAKRLIDKYNLFNKQIVEIGCGKGDFLLLLCELGHNRGVGIDPAWVPERVRSEAADRVLFIPEYYSDKHGKYSGDLICCRHTLEHIYSTADFVKTIRQAVDRREDSIVFFEVPDVGRVLRELAFWDIYYEHCSYFSPGTFARLFRFCGFQIIDLSKAFADQYLLIETRPTNKQANQLHQLEETAEQMARDVEYFSIRCSKKLDHWKEFFRKVRVNKRRAVVWGSGSKCVSFLTTIEIEKEIEYVIDVNPYRHGKFIPRAGKEVMPPEFLKEYKPDVILVMNPIYCKEIQEKLSEMNLAAELVPV